MEEMKELLDKISVDDAVCASCKEDDEYCENKCNLTIEIRQRILAKYALLEAENKRLKQQALAGQKAVEAVQTLINESKGVYGLHLNGDVSPWDELLKGGKYEDWLLPFSEYQDAVCQP